MTPGQKKILLTFALFIFLAYMSRIAQGAQNLADHTFQTYKTWENILQIVNAVVIYFFNILFVFGTLLGNTKFGFYMLRFDAMIKIAGSIVEGILLGSNLYSIFTDKINTIKPGVIATMIAQSALLISMLIFTSIYAIIFSGEESEESKYLIPFENQHVNDHKHDWN
eukprot:TRINITY_DN3220_c0_g1_i2.p1 TRINITY_DN3220_c0_g1~~TRINITY_DN3220_c0_g1_i2.p1  ORF type:complete len:167 (+),score=33.40 TRINITY_DN3220_c0_g1_i2:32-532(+)